jgi:putative Mg2+ transporter-C (MgtC) family protein
MPELPENVSQYWGLYIGVTDTVLRLLAALACGAIIGIEREQKQRPAGLRTHMLVALASALFTIIAFQIYAEVQASEDNVASDPLRLLEAITAGVAFLAAGAIIRRGDGIEGITTGGGLWLAGALGMACGQALYGLAFIGALLALVVLAGMRIFERRMLR